MLVSAIGTQDRPPRPRMPVGSPTAAAAGGQEPGLGDQVPLTQGSLSTPVNTAHCCHFHKKKARAGLPGTRVSDDVTDLPTLTQDGTCFARMLK